MKTATLRAAMVVGGVVLGAGGMVCRGYVFSPSDFATEVVEYVAGSGLPTDYLSGETFNNPAKALGRPTVDTTGDGFNIAPGEAVPVVPIYGAFRASELVTVGQGGVLTVKFDRRVMNDPANPYGIDLIVFGNAAGVGDDYWVNRDPRALTLKSALRAEKAQVSVSQDGTTWQVFANGPWADAFAPTLGRVLDESNPDGSIGQWNKWWGRATDPTRPLDPAMTMSDLAGKTVAEVAALYGESAGGAGFDIGAVGLDWIEYVRIENPAGSGVTPEIDAISDVAAVPEPGVMGLVVMGISVLGWRRRRTIADCQLPIKDVRGG